ncbi:actin filament organization App1-like protein [Aspergillus taichungensis]|uniref:Actin filament organization App1-like protein n=1 Tax=Aspergillus taichungensis TaxID=482145 RepID=A0A2J5HV84_9EURO|nr:actin filament organization App1-like protein [Aspergillus taichungensis]
MDLPKRKFTDPPAIKRLVKIARSSGVRRLVASYLWRSPSIQAADSRQHTVWLFDNTAYQSTMPKTIGKGHAWHVEVIACVFEKDSRKDISKLVATIADIIGLDGEVGTQREIRRCIAERLRPFLYHTAEAHMMMLEIPLPNHTTQIHQIGPTDHSGVSVQTVTTGSRGIKEGDRIRSKLRNWDSTATMGTIFAGPEGWLVISDIDDTIKYTKTSESTGILRTTFVDEPQPIAGTPQLYYRIEKQLQPAWFYVSAAPFNLYPFLRRFIHSHFAPGTLMLRDSSWLDVSELVRSFTVNTKAYKMKQIEKIHQWFPRRRVLCIGDSTQEDPETYAEIYENHPTWVRAIWIRKVTDVPHLEEQNSPQRFEAAFKNVPNHLWRVFEEPEEVRDLVARL